MKWSVRDVAATMFTIIVHEDQTSQYRARKLSVKQLPDVRVIRRVVFTLGKSTSQAFYSDTLNMEFGTEILFQQLFVVKHTLLPRSHDHHTTGEIQRWHRDPQQTHQPQYWYRTRMQ